MKKKLFLTGHGNILVVEEDGAYFSTALGVFQREATASEAEFVTKGDVRRSGALPISTDEFPFPKKPEKWRFLWYTISISCSKEDNYDIHMIFARYLRGKLVFRKLMGKHDYVRAKKIFPRLVFVNVDYTTEPPPYLLTHYENENVLEKRSELIGVHDVWESLIPSDSNISECERAEEFIQKLKDLFDFDIQEEIKKAPKKKRYYE